MVRATDGGWTGIRQGKCWEKKAVCHTAGEGKAGEDEGAWRAGTGTEAPSSPPFSSVALADLPYGGGDIIIVSQFLYAGMEPP